MESLFHICSMGYSAENKPLGTRDLQVFPPELTPYADGEITTDVLVMTDSGEDAFGQQYTVKAELCNFISATWLPFNSNRLTAPDIRRGERVLIWQYADVDKYYWTTTGQDDYLRRLETVVYAWSDTTDETVKTLTPDHCYFFEISTHRKLVTFSTSKTDGEPYQYVVQINTKDGTLTITDDGGNYIDLNSGEKRLRFENADGSKIHIDKRTIIGEALDSVTWTTKNFTVDASESFNVNAPQSTFSALVDVKGLLSMHAGMAALAGGGSATFAIPISSTAAIDTSADVTAGGKSLTGHTHAGVHGETAPPT